MTKLPVFGHPKFCNRIFETRMFSLIGSLDQFSGEFLCRFLTGIKHRKKTQRNGYTSISNSVINVLQAITSHFLLISAEYLVRF